MEYLEGQGLQPAPWEHEVLYDIFDSHDGAYSPAAPPHERQAYYAELAGRVFDRMGIRASTTMAAEHADALWAILGPACFDVFPDALETLQALRARGVPLAVVSNWQSGLRHFCAEIGLADYFDYVLSSADLGVQKPDRRIFLEACARLGVPPERTLHVGDTYLDDYIGGEAAGLQVVLIDRPGDSDVRDARAVRSLSDLLDFVVEPEGSDGGHS
jgi:HAD superfamily hydrolase (TIGR01549 family)